MHKMFNTFVSYFLAAVISSFELYCKWALDSKDI
jgi:hypothetical protein